MHDDSPLIHSAGDRDRMRSYLAGKIRRSYRAERTHRAGSRRHEANLEAARRDVLLEIWADFLSYEKPPGDVFGDLVIQQTDRSHNQP